MKSKLEKSLPDPWFCVGRRFRKTTGGFRATCMLQCVGAPERGATVRVLGGRP